MIAGVVAESVVRVACSGIVPLLLQRNVATAAEIQSGVHVFLILAGAFPVQVDH